MIIFLYNPATNVFLGGLNWVQKTQWKKKRGELLKGKKSVEV